jgi:hypothetical protein
VKSVQRIPLAGPVVEASGDGARALAEAYWAEIRKLTAGLVRVHDTTRGPELMLAWSIALFRFGPALSVADSERVECRFEIIGGVLAKQEGGSLAFIQRSTPGPELEVSVEGYVPLLSSPRERRSLRRLVYRQVQERAHTAIGRRYLDRMAERAR